MLLQTLRLDYFDSTSISEAVYDRDSEILTLKFVSNETVYEYEEVDEATYMKFAYADSQGEAFKDLIEGKFNYTKVDA
jgi:hypothetical protein